MMTKAFGVRWFGIAAGVLALVAVAGGVVGAQRPPGEGTGAREESDPAWHSPRGDLRQEFTARLAQKLGVSEETLQAAIAETRAEVRPLIQERLRERHERMRHRFHRLHERAHEAGTGAGSRGPFGAPPGPPGPGPQFGPEMLVGLSAEILQIEPEALRRELEAGKSLAQIAEERGVSAPVLAERLAARLEQLRLQQMREGILRFLSQPLRPPRE